MSLSLCFSPFVVPGLISVRVGLPHILHHRVDDGLTDEDAQVDHQIGIH